MKLSTLAITAATTAGVALAQPHKHQHAHLHDLNKRTQTETTWVSGPTAYAFVLDGQSIAPEDVCDGVASNKLKWADGAPAGLCSTSASAAATSSAVSSLSGSTTSSAQVSQTSAAAFYNKSGSSSQASSSQPTSSQAVSFQAASSKTASSQAASSKTASSTSGAAAAASSSWAAWNSSSSSTSSGVGGTFPDGQLDCSTFPSEYGAVALDYLGMGGWTGLQAVTVGQSAFTNIVTGVSGDTCTEGMMCSYACPPGYQKSQWPSTQGATGQSVGGIQCSGGKLHLTNSALSTSLCIPGKGGVQATNKASGVVAICRTDYPGTESETIPVELQPGETEQLANPDAATYYTWEGKGTSAQYYLNPIGTSARDGCQWASAGSNIGNWAPMNFGVGHSDGMTWLSIFQNSPTTTTLYSGTVEIQGDISGTCTFKNGQFCGATGCNTNGCTVSLTSGTATFVISA